MDNFKEELLEDYKKKVNILKEKIELLEQDIAGLEAVLDSKNFKKGFFSNLDEQEEARKNIESQIENHKKSLESYKTELYLYESSVYNLNKEINPKDNSKAKVKKEKENKKRLIKNKVKVTALTVAMASLIPLSVAVQNVWQKI